MDAVLYTLHHGRYLHCCAVYETETYKPVILKRRAKSLGLPVDHEGALIKRLLFLKFSRLLHILSTELSPKVLSGGSIN
jgi:hypothetical protein